MKKLFLSFMLIASAGFVSAVTGDDVQKGGIGTGIGVTVAPNYQSPQQAAHIAFLQDWYDKALDGDGSQGHEPSILEYIEEGCSIQ